MLGLNINFDDIDLICFCLSFPTLRLTLCADIKASVSDFPDFSIFNYIISGSTGTPTTATWPSTPAGNEHKA